MQRGARLLALVTAGIMAEHSVHAAVQSIDPFAGEATDTFNQHNSVDAVQSLPVLEGLATLDMLSDGGAIKLEFSSNLGGDQVTAISDMMAGQLGIAEWNFNQPMRRFGAWWENNSGADDATVEFFDDDGQLIDTMIADVPVDAQQWTWNGWESDTPFSSIRVTGNGLVNGFLWYENVQVSTIPSPSAAVCIAVALVCGSSRSRRRRIVAQ